MKANDKINNLNDEDKIWYIYFFVIIAALISNKYEKYYVLSNDIYGIKKAKMINIIIFIIALFIYLYFLMQNINGIRNINRYKEPKKFYRQQINLIAAILFLVAGFIYFYNECKSLDDIEIGII